MSRWYDKRPKLGTNLDKFKGMKQEVREPILNDIIELVKQSQPSLMTIEKAFDFRLNCSRLRWYEHDPHCWLVFNVLEIAKISTLESVEELLASRMSA